jgi:asparagine synthase (glutamine-hydrolysing)
MRTFTARSSDPMIDESIHAAKVASCVGAASQVVDVGSADLIKSIGDLVWHQDLPFAGASVVAQWMVFRAIAASGLKVVLDGQGADELLGGYDDYAAAAVIEAASRGHVFRAWRLLKGFARVGRTDPRRVVQLLALLYAPEPMLRWARRRRVGAALRIAAALRSTPEARRHQVASPVPRGTRPWRVFDALRTHQLEHGLRMLLRYEDRNSMAVGVESRVPLLDRDLAAVCRRMGAVDLAKSGMLKAPLRRSLTDRLGPECWQRHDKIGFAVSQSRWMDEHLDTVVSECMAFFASFTTLAPADGEALLRSMATDQSGSAVLWRVYCAAVWARVHCVLPA